MRKFVDRAEQITYPVRKGVVERGQTALIVTERAVFRVVPEGLMLTEVAKGIDVRRDILDQMAFAPAPDRRSAAFHGGLAVRRVSRDRRIVGHDDAKDPRIGLSNNDPSPSQQAVSANLSDLLDHRSELKLDCDVLVVGGGAAGVAAAVIAARRGARVVLVEKYGFCGGGAVAGLSGTICGMYAATNDVKRAAAAIGARLPR